MSIVIDESAFMLGARYFLFEDISLMLFRIPFSALRRRHIYTALMINLTYLLLENILIQPTICLWMLSSLAWTIWSLVLRIFIQTKQNKVFKYPFQLSFMLAFLYMSNRYITKCCVAKCCLATDFLRVYMLYEWDSSSWVVFRL